MLASWFRLKYPHIVIGALASSAPILYFDDITPENAYHVIVTKDFRVRNLKIFNCLRACLVPVFENLFLKTQNIILVLSEKCSYYILYSLCFSEKKKEPNMFSLSSMFFQKKKKSFQKL